VANVHSGNAATGRTGTGQWGDPGLDARPEALGVTDEQAGRLYTLRARKHPRYTTNVLKFCGLLVNGPQK
jgi:hypothetical protein